MPQDHLAEFEKLIFQIGKEVSFTGDGIIDHQSWKTEMLALQWVVWAAVLKILIIQTDQTSKNAKTIKIGGFTRTIIWQHIALASGPKVVALILASDDWLRRRKRFLQILVLLCCQY